MMAELEIDQTSLPRVQEVCQCFAVLEDGALAHNLQEQEIEQYYSTNIQKNQLVQNDIRVAKRLQDEEEEQWAQQSATLRQASRQMEEEDLEYARLIQAEILRRAEEAQRREQDDEEIAKRLQEEEKQRIRRGSREQEDPSDGSASDPALSSRHQHTLSCPRHAGEQYSSSTTEGRCSASHNLSNSTEPLADPHRGVAALRDTTSRSDDGRTRSFRTIRTELEEPSSEDSEESDVFLFEQLSILSQRLHERRNTAPPPRRQASLHQPRERKYRSLGPRSGRTDEPRVWEEEEEEERGEWKEGYLGNGDLEKRRARHWDQERNHGGEWEGLHGSRGQESGSAEVKEKGLRSESVGSRDGSRRSSRDLARTWSYRESPDKHVRFQENARRSTGPPGEHNGVWQMLGRVLRERGVPVRLGGNGAPLQITLYKRDGQDACGSEGPCSDAQPHQGVLQRAAATRQSFHGDVRERRRPSRRECSSGRDGGEGRDGRRDDGEACESGGGGSRLANGERGGGGRWRGGDAREGDAKGGGVERATGERKRWCDATRESASDGRRDVERRRREEPPPPRRRALQRSQSLSSRTSAWDRSKHAAAGASPRPEPSEASLDLGELRQVLKDEELARKLQEEEQILSRRSSERSPCSSYPEGDFRVAQVAQDEEIAHFMQKQEIKSKRRSQLEGPTSWREHRAMINHHDRRATRDRQVQRERLDSEGLPSPTDDGVPDNQPPSPDPTSPQAQPIRNIAEELDPTFQARRQSTESLRVGQTVSTCQSLPTSQSGLHDLLEEPAFIPPTKRQTDKSARAKLKEKKENCKQQ